MPDWALAAAIRSAISANVAIRRAAGLVMQIVELDIGGIARLQHLHLHEGGDRLHMLRRQPVENRNISCRQVQNESDASGPRFSVRPAMAR